MAMAMAGTLAAPAAPSNILQGKSMAARRHQLGFSRCVVNARRHINVCRAVGKGEDTNAAVSEGVEESKKSQLQATEILAEILKSSDKEKTANEHVGSLTEEFFYIAATYLHLAKKEANGEVVSQIEAALRAAMEVKDKTLRPEVQLLNKLIRNNSTPERQQTIQENHQYLHEDSYFFELLSLTMKDVEDQKETPDRTKLLNQLRIISKQTKDVAKMLKRAKAT